MRQYFVPCQSTDDDLKSRSEKEKSNKKKMNRNIDSNRCVPQVQQAICASLGLPRFSKITEVIPDSRLRFHLYGIITIVIEDPLFCGSRKIIHIRDESCPPDGEFRVHVNFFMRSMQPRLEVNRIVRLINVKVETYSHYLDGRVFSGRDVTSFPELGNGTEGAESPSGNYKFGESDIKRITELRNWISQERLQPGFLDLQFRQLFPTINFFLASSSADVPTVAQHQDTSNAVGSSSTIDREGSQDISEYVIAQSSVGPASAALRVGPASAAPCVGPASAAPCVGPASAAPFVGPASAVPFIGPASPGPSVGPASAAPSVGPASAAPSVGPASAVPFIGPALPGPSVGPASSAPPVAPASAALRVGPASAAPSVGPASAVLFIGPASPGPSVGPASSAPPVGPASAAPFVGPVSPAPFVSPASAVPFIGPALPGPSVGPASPDPPLGPASPALCSDITLLSDIKEEGTYTLLCQVLQVIDLPTQSCVLTVTDGTTCSFLQKVNLININVSNPSVHVRRIEDEDFIKIVVKVEILYDSEATVLFMCSGSDEDVRIVLRGKEYQHDQSNSPDFRIIRYSIERMRLELNKLLQEECSSEEEGGAAGSRSNEISMPSCSQDEIYFTEITMNTENVKKVDFSYLEDESNPRKKLYLIQGRLTQVEPSSPRDMVRAYCITCKNWYSLHKGRDLHCSHCLKEGKRNYLKWGFFSKLYLTDRDEKQLIVYLCNQHAVDFLGFDDTVYFEDEVNDIVSRLIQRRFVLNLLVQELKVDDKIIFMLIKTQLKKIAIHK